jgi:hypothetical protein
VQHIGVDAQRDAGRPQDARECMAAGPGWRSR